MKRRVAVVDDQAKLQLKHQALLQHHLNLQKEVASKKKKLKVAKHKRDILLAEIRFLRRKRMHLLKLKSAVTKPQGAPRETSNGKLNKLSRKRGNDGSEVVSSKHSHVVVQGKGEQLL